METPSEDNSIVMNIHEEEEQVDHTMTEEEQEIEEIMCGFQFGAKEGFEKKKLFMQTIDLESMYTKNQEDAIIFLTAISPIALLLPVLDPLKTHLFVLSGCNAEFSLTQIQVCSLTSNGCELSNAFHDASTENLTVNETNRHIVLKTLRIYLESTPNVNKFKRVQASKSPSESEQRFLNKYSGIKHKFDTLSESSDYVFESEFCFEALGSNQEIRQYPLTFFKGERTIEGFEDKVVAKRKELFHLIFKPKVEVIQSPPLKEVPNSPKQVLPPTKRIKKSKHSEAPKKPEKGNKKKRKDENGDPEKEKSLISPSGLLKIDISRPKNLSNNKDEAAQLMQIIQKTTGLSPTNIVVIAQTLASLLERLPS